MQTGTIPPISDALSIDPQFAADAYEVLALMYESLQRFSKTQAQVITDLNAENLNLIRELNTLKGQVHS